jgi:enoyl-CoA hydratase/carnithine racemase
MMPSKRHGADAFKPFEMPSDWGLKGGRMPSLETVLYEKTEGIAVISLNRPKVLNAQNRQLVSDFLSALKAAEADPEVTAVIVRGEGRAFCAGDDLSEDHCISDPQEGFRMIDTLQDTTRAIMGMPKPVIAAVHGYALGAGCEWAMNCDIRIAAEGTRFGFPEASVGATVTNAGTKLLPLLVGLGRAKELLFTTEKIDAATAERWGLVNRMVPQEKLMEAAMDTARKISRNSLLSIALSKKALNQGACQGFEETLEQEARDIAIVLMGMESAERAKAALAKTKDKAGGR